MRKLHVAAIAVAAATVVIGTTAAMAAGRGDNGPGQAPGGTQTHHSGHHSGGSGWTKQRMKKATPMPLPAGRQPGQDTNLPSDQPNQPRPAERPSR